MWDVVAQPLCRTIAVITIITSPARGDSVFLYGGPGIQGPLQNLIQVTPPDFSTDALVSLGVGRSLLRFDKAALELEGLIARRFGEPAPFELDLSLVFRWFHLPWRRALPGSFGLGNGVSWASQAPRLLYFISLELEFHLSSRWAGFLRVHHRSGAFGLIDDQDAGSNFLVLGLRLVLPGKG